MRIKEILKKLRGRPIFQLKLFGLALISVGKPSEDKINFFLLYIPIFRIIKSKTRFGFNLLVLAWIFDFIHGLNVLKEQNSKKLRCNNHVFVEIINSPQTKGIKIFGRNFYTITVRKPYNFPTAAFKG